MRWMLLLFVMVACNGDKGGPAVVDPVEQCIEHASPLLPWTGDADDTGDVVGEWDDDDDGDGWTLDQGDCDDTDPAVNPSYTEVGGNGIDENCDGSDAAPTRRLDDAAWRWQGKANNTGGRRVAFAGDTNGDGVQEALIGVPDEGAALDYDGYNERVLLVNLSGEGSGREVAQVDPVDANGNSGQAGRDGLTGGVDLNLDGYDDFAVAQPHADGVDWRSLQYAGEVLLYLGPVTGTLTELDADARVGANIESMGLGYRLEMVSAVNTVDDRRLLATVAGAGVDGFAFGWTYPFTDGDAIEMADVRFTHPSAEGSIPLAIDADTDFTGDGIVDTVVGEPTNSDSGIAASGRIYIVPGPSHGDVNLDDDACILTGEVESAYAGYSIAPAGDTNSDGYEDLLIGGALHPEADTRGGKAWLVQGPITTSSSLADAAGSVVAERGYEWLGYEVAGLGDANGDGALDIAISAPRDFYYGAGYPGKVYIFSTPLEGAWSGADADLVVAGVGINDGAGAGLDAGRDIDGDCLGDLLVGAPFRDDVGKDAGMVYLMTGLSW